MLWKIPGMELLVRWNFFKTVIIFMCTLLIGVFSKQVLEISFVKISLVEIISYKFALKKNHLFWI